MRPRRRSSIVASMPTHAHVARRLLRVPLPLPRTRRASLILILSTLLLATLLLTAAGSRTATADADASYSAGGAMVATEKWTYRGTGHPKPCVAWTEADGTVRSRVYAKTGFTFRRIPQVGAIGGMTGSGSAKMNVSRQINYRIHAVGQTPDCTPCGPLSEYGPCGDAVPDIVGDKGCAPHAGDGVLTATFVGTSLLVEGVAPSEVILRNCSALIPHGVPLGTPEPKLRTTRFRGAARKVERLKPGQKARFARTVKRGTGCKSNKGEMRSCTTYEAVVVVTRED